MDDILLSLLSLQIHFLQKFNDGVSTKELRNMFYYIIVKRYLMNIANYNV
jgi:hypothetical protein